MRGVPVTAPERTKRPREAIRATPAARAKTPYGLAALAAALALAAGAGRAAAQAADRPQLVIAMTGGYLTGPRLWSLGRQYVPSPSGAVDSVSLERLFRTGFIAGVGATLYRSPNLGLSVEIAFVGLPTESRCAPLGPFATDSRRINQQACLAMSGLSLSTNAATFQTGFTWRAQPGAAIQPYVRGMAGFAVLGGSFVTSEGVVSVPSADTTSPPTILRRSFLDDPGSRALTWVASLAIGASLKVNEGSRVRFELRDMILNVPIPSGPAPLPASPPTAPLGNRTIHLPGFNVSLELLMERERTRRY